MKKRIRAGIVVLATLVASIFVMMPNANATEYIGHWHCQYLDHSGIFKDVNVCTQLGYRPRVGVKGWYVEEMWIHANGCHCEDRIYGLKFGLNGNETFPAAHRDSNSGNGFQGHWVLNRATGADPVGWSIFGTVGEAAQPDQSFHTHGTLK